MQKMILVDSEEKISFAHNGLILLDVFWIQTIPNQETILANIHQMKAKWVLFQQNIEIQRFEMKNILLSVKEQTIEEEYQETRNKRNFVANTKNFKYA